MKCARLEDMIKGWFIGAFEPVAFSSEACEVAVKHYLAGDREDFHHHRVATEITVVVRGTIRMMGKTWESGDILVLHPGEATDFHALTDCTNVVVKLPSVRGDKYPGTADAV